MNRSKGVKDLRQIRGIRAAALAPLLLALSLSVPETGDRFDPDRALAHVRALAEPTGPRVTGAEQQRRARDYVADQLRRIGLRVRRIGVPRVGSTYVGSENIIGVLEGRTQEVILVSSHHDSRARGVAGANDDASGMGVMLEAARCLASEPPVATVLFASFCAEEEGLLGSRHYAASEDLSRVRVAVNIDSVGQREIFVAPFPGPPPLWASRAVARVARIEGIPRVLHDPLHAIAPRGMRIPFGADHEPFVDRGVPAFSISGRLKAWTHHTDEDLPRWIDRGAIESAGRLLLGLVRRFDEAPPLLRDDGGYVLVNVAGEPFFIVTSAIMVLAGLAPVLGLLWWRSIGWRAVRRGRRFTAPDAARATARCAAPVAGLVGGALLSEAVADLITGFAVSWSARHELHLVHAGVWSAAGMAAGWILAERVGPPGEVEIYTVASCLASGAAGLGSVAAGRPDLGFYFLLPAAATLGASLIRPALAGLGTLAGYLPLLDLISPTGYRDAVELGGLSPPAWLAGPAIVVAAMPLALGMARTLPPPPRRARQAAVLLLSGLGVVTSGMVAMAPAYDDSHRRIIRVQETLDLTSAASRATILLESSEYLRSLGTTAPGLPELDARSRRHEITVEAPESLVRSCEPRVAVEPVEAISSGDHLRDIRILSFPPRPSAGAVLTISSLEPLRHLDDGVWVRGHRFNRRHVSSDGTTSEVFRLAGRPGQIVDIDLRLEFDEDILGFELSADHTVFRWRSIVRWRGTATL